MPPKKNNKKNVDTSSEDISSLSSSSSSEDAPKKKQSKKPVRKQTKKPIKKPVARKQKRVSTSSSDSSSESEDEPIKSVIKRQPIKNIQDAGSEEDSADRSASTYVPIIFTLPAIKENIFDETENIIFTNQVEYPLGELGFHHWIHQNKNKTSQAFKQFEGKKKVYLVMNKFERYVDGYDQNIGNVSKEYFSLDKKPDILSRGFYKLWEMICIFDLIDIAKEKFVSVHLAEGPGSFIQATMFYRDMYCKKGLSKNDKYHAITLHQEDIGDYHVPKLEDKFTDFYEKENPKRFILHKTFPKNMSGGSKEKDNGDLTNPKTIKLFGGEVTEKADFITGDGGFEWKNENLQEQEAYKLILSQIISAFKVQKKGGHFVCKFFETFTKTSVKFICMLSQIYENIYFIKPLMSRPSNSEKYVICKGFKYDSKSKEYKSIEKQLDNMIKNVHNNQTQMISNIFSKFVIPQYLLNFMICANTAISNLQYKSIGEILVFIAKEIYSGDEYHSRKNEQIEGSKYWVQTFLPDITKYNEMKKVCSSMIKQNNNVNNEKCKQIEQSLVPVLMQN